MIYRPPRSHLFLVALLSLSPSILIAQVTITPTTTLAAETANNTSAADTFKTQPDGNMRATNISKLPVQSLLYSGSATTLFAHVVTWFGDAGHMDVGYTSSDSAQIHKQVTDMLSRGITGAVLDWDGPEVALSTNTIAGFRTEAESQGGNFEFAVMEDVNSVVQYAQQNGCDVTQKIIADLDYASTNFEVSTAYLRNGGRPVVFFFGTEDYYVDWNKVRSSVSGNPQFVFENYGGFGWPQSSGAFGWMNLDSGNPGNQDLGGLDSLYSAAQQNPSKLVFGAGYKGFNDTLAAWSSNRVMSQQCGETWLATLAEAGKYYSSSNQLPYLQLVTWNDYEEGTELETGIDNCVSISASTQGSNLNWILSGSGKENTVSTFRVWISNGSPTLPAGSQQLMKLNDVAPGTHSLDLSQYALGSSTYTLFVEAIGKASIANQMSPAVTYRPGHQPPSVSISPSTNTGTAPVTVTATVNASAASDSTISSTSIDFGDGAVMNGPVASHQYGNAGTYILKGTATDSLGVSSSATTPVTITASPNYGVNISSPAPGNVNSQFVEVRATAASPNPPITAIWVYVDQVVAYQSQNQSSIDASLKLDNGSHYIEVQAWDWTGALFKSGVTINVLAPQSTLVAALDVNPLSALGQYGVMACSARSTDSNGFITSSTIDFGDGTTQSGTTGLHNYAAAGTYNVKTTVTDNHGYTSSTSSNVSVNGQPPNPPIAQLSVTPSSGPAPLSVSASTSGSTDPDGIISSSINFGDGTSAPGPTAQHTYNNSGTYTVTATVTDNAGLSSTATATVSVGGTLADNNAFVTQQYQDFLDRQPGADGLNGWTSALNNSSITRPQLIADFMGSSEFASEGKFVAQAYVGLLGRDADYDGFRYWIGWLESEGTETALVDAFTNSPEFVSYYGSSLSDSQVVTRMYQNILQREPDSGGLNYWVGQITSGAMTRAQVALGFLQSSEFQDLANTQNRVAVTLLYFDMLRRQPDSGGFSGWVNALNSGTALTDVISVFLNSSEYANRFQ